MQIHVAKRISAKFFLLLSEPDLTQVVLNFHALILSGMANKKPNSYAIQSTFSQCEFLASPVLRHIRLKQGWILQIKHIFHLTLVCLKNARYLHFWPRSFVEAYFLCLKRDYLCIFENDHVLLGKHLEDHRVRRGCQMARMTELATEQAKLKELVKTILYTVSYSR